MPIDPDEPPERSYLRALAVLDGAAAAPADPGDRNVFSVVAAEGGGDTTIAPTGLTVLWAHSRKPFRYYSSLGPGVLSTLRLHAPGGSLARPFRLDGATLSTLGFFLSGDRWFWVSRAPDAIRIACRPPSGSGGPPASPEPLPPWRPAEKVFARFGPPRACRYCGARPERYRLVEDVLICLACGRSERVTAEDLHAASLERAG